MVRNSNKIIDKVFFGKTTHLWFNSCIKFFYCKFPGYWGMDFIGNGQEPDLAPMTKKPKLTTLLIRPGLGSLMQTLKVANFMFIFC